MGESAKERLRRRIPRAWQVNDGYGFPRLTNALIFLTHLRDFFPLM